jgi:serine/threonine-protein kinase
VSDEVDSYLGRELAGHIEIQKLVGTGAMGRVYRAFQSGIDRDVAVKVLHRELSSNQQLAARFTREAKVASRLAHPNVVQVLLSGQLPDGALYIVMEYLDGLSLQSALLGTQGVFPLHRALHVAIQLCDAVGEAHSQGIVHRDLKPENVMLVRRGEDPDFVKVLDFGIARINWGEQSMATQAGLIFGTARYISPEGAQGHVVGPPSDVYSIATLLFQMLAGRTPFEGDQTVGLLLSQIHESPPDLLSLPHAAEVPAPIAQVVMKNLAKEASTREPDARALGRALIDAARASGLAPDEISRPTLVGRGSQPQAAPATSLSQTRLATADAVVRTPGPTDVAGPSVATVQWTPPADVQARMAAGLAPIATPRDTPRGTMPSAGTPEGRASVPSEMPPATPVPQPAAANAPKVKNIADTLDDAAQGPTADEIARHLGQRTGPEYGAAPFTPAAAPARISPAPRRPTPVPHSEPTDEAPEPEGPSRVRTVAIVALCFVFGAFLAALVAFKMGRIGPDAGKDESVTRAQDALAQHRLVGPAVPNVKDLTDDGLRRWPQDPRWLELRVKAARELVQQATVAHGTGNLADALRLLRAAKELDPADAQIARLLSQYEAELSPGTAASLTGTATSPIPPLPVGKGTVAVGVTVPVAPNVAARATLDVSNARPRVAQPIELSAKVAGAKGKVTDAEFSISGPGIPGAARISAAEDGGRFRVSYTFMDSGSYEIVFVAKVDGGIVRASRTVVSGESAPAVPPTPRVPTAAPSASVHWL